MSIPTLDPTLAWSARVALSLLFGVAAAHKLRDVAAFRLALERYELLPPLWAVPAGAALIGLEVGIAAGLWLPPTAPVAALGAAALLLLYAGAIAVNLMRGRRDIDCGCAGPARRQPISGWLVVRNALLAASAVAAALPVAVRPLSWVDAMTLIAAVTAVSLLYAAAEGLMAAAARTRSLLGLANG